MTADVSVIVPYWPDGGHRDRAWAWNRSRWETFFPNWELIVDDGGGSQTAAVNRAAARSSGQIIVTCDADSTFDPDWVANAVSLVDADIVPWVLPRWYHKLTEAVTHRILSSPPTIPLTDPPADWSGDSVSVAGLRVMPREAFEMVGGQDERFVTWGADDVVFATMLNGLWGKATRLEGAVFHLWHPVSLDYTYGNPEHRRQHELMLRYVEAGESGDPERLRQVRFG